jgi:hypothetical protein
MGQTEVQELRAILVVQGQKVSKAYLGPSGQLVWLVRQETQEPQEARAQFIQLLMEVRLLARMEVM